MKIKLPILLIPLVLLTACAGVDSRSSQWQSLTPLKEYPASAFKLQQDVNYLEIRQYVTSSGRESFSDKPVVTPYDFRKYTVLFQIAKKPLASFGAKTRSDFKALNPVLNKKTNIRRINIFGRLFSHTALANAFYIKSGKKMGALSKKETVFPLLDKIDTPAEAQLALWLHDKPEGKSYRKVSNGYEAIVEFDNSIENHGECGWFKYQAHIGSKGKLLEYKLLEKKDSKEGCMVYD